MKIGIFGGSFNPPHKMHLHIASTLLKEQILDKIIFVPTGNCYQKKGLIDAKERIQMLKLMVQDFKNMDVSDYELKSALTYTYQTLDYFQQMYSTSELYLIIGSDNLKEIQTWKNYAYILEKYKLLVVKRNKDNLENILKNIPSKNIVISSIEQNDLSSTQIRDLIKENKVLSPYLEQKVLQYIKEKDLYKVVK